MTTTMTAKFEAVNMVANAGGSISFMVKGNPTVQRRTVMCWKGRPQPCLLDPSKNTKDLFAKAVRLEMKAIGLPELLYFAESTAIALRVKFVLPRPKKDLVKKKDGLTGLTDNASSFPRGKDVDNLLKFVQDALQQTLYMNDSDIVRVEAEKCYCNEDITESLGWTELHFWKVDAVVCLD